MSLIERLIEPTKEYICFRDFLCHLSGSNDSPLYEVVTYLLNKDLNQIGFYYIDTDYKIIEPDFRDLDMVHSFLEKVQSAVVFSANWVFSGSESLEQLNPNDRIILTNTVWEHAHHHFKKADLLSFEPLDGLLHFDNINNKESKTKEPTQQEIGKYQRLLITYSLFTPDQVVCLLIDENPACISHNDEYHACCDMVSTALDANELTPINEKYQIKAEQVKAWFTKCGFIFTGFNDKIDQSSQQLIDVQENIVPLATDYDDIQAPSIIYPAEPPKDIKVHTDLGEYQKELITYDVFTPNQIICLILNYPPNSSSSDRQFISYMIWIDSGIKSDELTTFKDEEHNDEQLITAQQVKVWLARNNYIYEGFNDNIPADPVEQVRQLTAQLTDAQATIDQLNTDCSNAQIDIANLTSQLKQASTALADAPANDADLNPKTLSAITRLLNVLFHKAQLDITAHKGTTNKNIVNTSISLNAKITEKPVSHWIRQVQQLRIDTQDRNN